jgi:hypothetical protein
MLNFSVLGEEEKGEEIKLEHKVSLDEQELGFINNDDSADAGIEIDEASDEESVCQGYMDHNNAMSQKKKNPFLSEKIKRNTMNARPSHMLELDLDYKDSPHKRLKPTDDVEIIVEEMED